MSKAYSKPRRSIVPTILIGVVLMVVGFYFSTNYFAAEVKPEWLVRLEQMGIPLDPGKTVASLGVLLIVFPILQVFFIKPLGEAIETRNSELESTFAEADSLRSRMQQMRDEYEQRLTESEANARERIEAQIKEAQALRQSLMSEATARADELVRRAEQEIAQERERVLTGLRTEVVDLALAAAEKVVRENMDTARNRRLVEDFVSQIEVKR